MSEPHNERLSDILRRVGQEAGSEMSLGDLVVAFGERAFGALILIFAAPNLIPLPPGSSSVFAAPLIFITAQLMIGRQRVWLPKRLARVRLGGERLRQLTERMIPWVLKAEKLLKPRGTLLTSPLGERLAGGACFFLSVVLFLPIPLANMVPALALCLFALGLIEQDGMAMAGGWLATAATVAILVLVANALIAAVKVFVYTVFGM
ncbi:MAG: exopolysaccharide biosynthesis protein [Parvibaculaceae bacterium]